MQNVKIPEMICALLCQFEMQQKDLSEVAGVSESTISQWCAGKRTPSVNTLVAIADYFGVSLDYLVLGKGDSTRMKVCRNCGKRFLPQRSDALYCKNPSPQEPSLNCSEYNSRRLSYKRQTADALATFSRNILAQKCMAAKRNPEKRPEYDAFRKDRILWKRKYESAVVSGDEYYEWLDSNR